MRPRHLLLALLVPAIWGLSFPLSAVALDVVPPFLLVALRYAVVAIPTVFLVPRPRVRPGWFLLYAAGTGVGQFGLLYAGIAAGLPAGLASVVIQSVGPFSVILGVLWLRQSVRPVQWIGVAVATAGLVVIGLGRAPGSSLLPLLLVLLAGLCWAVANVGAARAQSSSALEMSLWACVVPPVPMALLALAVDGPAKTWGSMNLLLSPGGIPALLCVLFVGLLATAFGFGAWTVLLHRYPVHAVAPLAMLTPVTGLASSALLLGEGLNPLEGVGSVIVVAGVLAPMVLRRPPDGANEAP
ncbi:MAG: O-acetylserine/cysteine efflux transporter [Microbacteriaceae bacterium]|nr:O-acetylserine/cysteine efflux transporter [Microbacteriaceae bacterium]